MIKEAVAWGGNLDEFTARSVLDSLEGLENVETDLKRFRRVGSFVIYSASYGKPWFVADRLGSDMAMQRMRVTGRFHSDSNYGMLRVVHQVIGPGVSGIYEGIQQPLPFGEQDELVLAEADRLLTRANSHRDQSVSTQFTAHVRRDGRMDGSVKRWSTEPRELNMELASRDQSASMTRDEQQQFEHSYRYSAMSDYDAQDLISRVDGFLSHLDMLKQVG